MTRLLVSSVLLLLFQLSPTAATPPFSFSTRTDLKAPTSVAVVSADFNGDGIADLAALSAVSIRIFLGEGKRRFAAPTSIPLGGGVSAYDTLAALDINGDGRPDLIVSGGNTLIFFGNGDGTFTAGPTIATWGLPVVGADFNLDGKLDLAFAQGNAIVILLGKGDGTFSPPVMLRGAGSCLAVGDFNGDGKPDVIGCGFTAGSPTVSTFLGRGDGSFRPPIASAVPSPAIYATVGDLNGDGKLDVAAVATHENGSNPNLGPVYVLYGKGDGSFQTALQVHTDIGPVFSVGIGDLNGDGLPDLVAASIGGIAGADFFGGLVGTYLNRGAGQGFAFGNVYPVTFLGALPWETMLVTDLTGDQRPEVVVSGGGPFFSTLFNDGTGSFSDVQAINLPGVSFPGLLYNSPGSVAQADFNGDGLGDLGFVIQKGGAYKFNVFFGTGKASQTFRSGPSTPLQPTTGFTPFSMVSADFNGDGKPDIAISYSNGLLTSSYVQIYLGNGGGTFTAGSTLSVPMVGAQMIAADFNGDGKLDLASSSGFLALGNGDGTFQTAAVFYQISPLENTFGVWLGAGDFNHDGKLDLAFQTPQDPIAGQNLLILLGNGDGTFQNPTAYSWGDLPIWGAVADLNGDGNADIVMTGQQLGHAVAVFLGKSDGSFQPPAYVQGSSPLSPLSILAGDFNGDGKPDLALMDWRTSSVHLFAGKGDGTFERDVECGAASSMIWIGRGNYGGQNKIGYPDLVMVDDGANFFYSPSGPGAGAISILLNSGWKK